MNTLYQTLEDLENRNEYLSSENRAGYIPQSNIFWTQNTLHNSEESLHNFAENGFIVLSSLNSEKIQLL